MSRPPESGDHLRPLDELFSDLVDGRLPPEQQLALRQRLDRDPELRREFERFQRMLAVLHAERSLDLERGDPEPPADLTADILAALRGDHGSGRPPGGGRSLLPYLASLFSAAAAVLLFLLLLPHERPRGAADVLRVGELDLVDESGDVDKVAAGNTPAEEARRQVLRDRDGAVANPEARFRDATRPPEDSRALDESRLEKSAKAAAPAPAKKAKAEPPAQGGPVTGGGGGGKAVPPASAPQGTAIPDTAIPDTAIPDTAIPGTAVPVRGDVGGAEKQKAAAEEGKAGDDNAGKRWAGDAGRRGVPEQRAEAKSRDGETGSKDDDRDELKARTSRPGAPAPVEQPRGLVAQREQPSRESQIDLPMLGLLSANNYQALATGLTCLSVTVADVEAQAALEQSFAALQPQVFYSSVATLADNAAVANDRNLAGFWFKEQSADSRAAGSGAAARYLFRVRAPADRLQASLVQLQAAATQLQSRVVSLDAGSSALVLSPDSQWRSFGWPRGADMADQLGRLARLDDLQKLEAEREAGVDRFGSEPRGGGAGSQPGSRPTGGLVDSEKAPGTEPGARARTARTESGTKESDDKHADGERAAQADEKGAANETRKAEQPRPAGPGGAARGAGRTAGTGTRSGPDAPGAPKGPTTGGPATPGPTPGAATPVPAPTDPAAKPLPQTQTSTAAKDAPIDFYLLVIYPRTAPAENKSGR